MPLHCSSSFALNRARVLTVDLMCATIAVRFPLCVGSAIGDRMDSLLRFQKVDTAGLGFHCTERRSRSAMLSFLYSHWRRSDMFHLRFGTDI
jgi:hypothetical protein